MCCLLHVVNCLLFVVCRSMIVLCSVCYCVLFVDCCSMCVVLLIVVLVFGE